MTDLIKAVNLTDHDDLFERLVALHRGLDEAACREVDARLILLLMNHIGDCNVIAAAFEAARPRDKTTSIDL
jgi:hypothetical protein